MLHVEPSVAMGMKQEKLQAGLSGPGPAQAGVALHCPGDGLIQAHHGAVAHGPLGPLTAVVVEGPSQGHPHGREGGLDGHQGPEQGQQQGQQQGQVIGQPVGNVVLGRVVVQAGQDPGHECPEGNWFIVGDVKGLEREGEEKPGVKILVGFPGLAQ